MTLDEQRRRKTILRYKERARWFWLGFGACALLAIVFFFQKGELFSFSNEQSLELPDAKAVETTVEVKALMSFCGAEVEAQYSGFAVHKEHTTLGKVYRTDTVSGTATTNVVVCIDAEGYTSTIEDGQVNVKVEPTSMQLLVPSVNHWSTQTDYNDGADLLNSLNPMVAENNDLLDVTYMWLQLQATEGACVDEAWETVIKQMKSSIVSYEMKRAEDESRTLSRLAVHIEIDEPQTLEEARQRVLADINLSGHRQRTALSLVQDNPGYRIDDIAVTESCKVVTEA